MQPNEQNNNGFYSPSQQAYDSNDDSDEPRGEKVEWEASEYVQHDKGIGWLVIVLLVALALLAGAIYLQQWTLAILVVVMAGAFGYFGFRKPRVVHYVLSQNGIVINGRQYIFKDFRSFTLSKEGAFYSVMLIPVKRLSPGVNIYFSQQQADPVLDTISDHLPLEKTTPDPFDVIMRRLRF